MKEVYFVDYVEAAIISMSVARRLMGYALSTAVWTFNYDYFGALLPSTAPGARARPNIDAAAGAAAMRTADRQA